MGRMYTRFQNRKAQNHTLRRGCTYLYGLYKGVPFPRASTILSREKSIIRLFTNAHSATSKPAQSLSIYWMYNRKGFSSHEVVLGLWEKLLSFKAYSRSHLVFYNVQWRRCSRCSLYSARTTDGK